MGQIKKVIEKEIPDVHVKSVRIGNNEVEVNNYYCWVFNYTAIILCNIVCLSQTQK